MVLEKPRAGSPRFLPKKISRIRQSQLSAAQGNPKPGISGNQSAPMQDGGAKIQNSGEVNQVVANYASNFQLPFNNGNGLGYHGGGNGYNTRPNFYCFGGYRPQYSNGNFQNFQPRANYGYSNGYNGGYGQQQHVTITYGAPVRKPYYPNAPDQPRFVSPMYQGNSQRALYQPITCFECNEKGYYHSECPKLKDVPKPDVNPLN